MEQLAPMLIMLAITLLAAGLLLLPTRIKYEPKVINFYWSGFWKFLALIALIAGGSNALILIGVEVDPASNMVLTGIMYAYIAFVVIGWFHICGAAFLKGLSWFSRPEKV